MADIEDDDLDGEEMDERIVEIIEDNGLLLHAAIKLLVKKGILTPEELDQEIQTLYEDEDDAEGEEAE